MLLIRDERNSVTKSLAYQAQRLANRSGEVVWYVTTKLTTLGGWNSAEYQRSDHNRNEDKGRSAGEGMEAKGETMSNQKDDSEKPRYDLIPTVALASVVAVMTFGARKYKPEGWRGVTGWRARYFAAACRHIFAWWGGQYRDEESGLPHLAHAVCCLMFCIELEEDDGGGE